MYEWLNPFAKSNNNTCPFDRRVLFPKLPHFLNTEGIQVRLDLVDWFNGAREREPVGAKRDQTAAPKAPLVEHRLREAMEELNLDRSATDDLMQLRINAPGMDAAFLSTCHRELQRFEHRLTAIGTTADSMPGHLQISTLQARLQRMTKRLARY